MDRYRLCKPEQARLVYSAPSWLVVPEGALNRSRQKPHQQDHHEKAVMCRIRRQNNVAEGNIAGDIGQ
jgi:hypothetical protein